MKNHGFVEFLKVFLVTIGLLYGVINFIGCAGGGGGAGSSGGSSLDGVGSLFVELPFPDGYKDGIVKLSGDLRGSESGLAMKLVPGTVAYVINVYDYQTTTPVVEPERVEKPDGTIIAKATIEGIPVGMRTVWIGAYDESEKLIGEGSQDVYVNQGNHNELVAITISATATAPEVVLTIPDSGAVDVEVGDPIRSRFSETMDHSTFTSSSFYLNPQEESTFSFDDPVTILTPTNPLGLLTEYEAVITTGVTDADGTAMEEEYKWNFITKDGSWKGELLSVSDPNTDNKAPQVAMDPSGNAIAVWEVSNGNIMASRYTPGDGWDSPQPINILKKNMSAKGPAIAIDASGNAIAVWQQETAVSATYGIAANRYDASSNRWTGDDFISSQNSSMDTPCISADGTGNFMVVWNSNMTIYSNKFDSNGRWKGESAVSSGIVSGGYTVELSSNGTGFAIWTELVAGYLGVFVSRYVPGNGWSSPNEIDQSSIDCANPDIAVDSSGNAIATWIKGSPGSLMAGRYSAGSTWSAEEDINPSGIGSVTPDSPEVEMESSDHGIIVWTYTNSKNVGAIRFDGTRWINMSPLDTGVQSVDNPNVEIDGNGNAIVVWEQNAVSDVYARRFFKSSETWNTPEKLNSGLTPSKLPQLAMNKKGYAVCVWQKGLTNQSIHSNHFK